MYQDLASGVEVPALDDLGVGAGGEIHAIDDVAIDRRGERRAEGPQGKGQREQQNQAGVVGRAAADLAQGHEGADAGHPRRQRRERAHEIGKGAEGEDRDREDEENRRQDQQRVGQQQVVLGLAGQRVHAAQQVKPRNRRRQQQHVEQPPLIERSVQAARGLLLGAHDAQPGRRHDRPQHGQQADPDRRRADGHLAAGQGNVQRRPRIEGQEARRLSNGLGKARAQRQADRQRRRPKQQPLHQEHADQLDHADATAAQQRHLLALPFDGQRHREPHESQHHQDNGHAESQQGHGEHHQAALKPFEVALQAGLHAHVWQHPLGNRPHGEDSLIRPAGGRRLQRDGVQRSEPHRAVQEPWMRHLGIARQQSVDECGRRRE